MKKSFKERAAYIRDLLSSQERFADILCNIGIEVSRDFKFSLREERTASAKVYNNGTAFDFGGVGERLDIVDITAAHLNKSNIEALEMVEDMLGIDNQGKSSYEFKAPVYSLASGEREYDDTPIEESRITFFKDNLQKFKSKATRHLQKLMPTANDVDINKMIKHFEFGYDAKTDRITFPIRSVKGEILNIGKYTSEPGIDEQGKEFPKIRYYKGRRRTIINLQALENNPETLLILEGEKDVFNATLAGRAAISQGAASGWKTWMTTSIQKACEYYKVEVPKIGILQDNDKPGIKATLKIYTDMKKIQPKTKMIFWTKNIVEKISAKAKSKNTEDMSVINLHEIEPRKGFDYTDYKVEMSKKAP